MVLGHAPYLCRTFDATPSVVVAVCDGSSALGGGAWAWLVVVVGCARALSLISVLDPGLPWVGDMMVGGMVPLGYALRPLGL